jgi:hypothetical protein
MEELDIPEPRVKNSCFRENRGAVILCYAGDTIFKNHIRLD